MPNPVLIGSELAVSGRFSDDRTDITPEVTTLSDGRFVVVWREALWNEDWDWESGIGFRNEINVIGRVFQTDGTPVSAPFVINTITANHQFSPTVAALPNGGFVSAWVDHSASGGDTSGMAIRGQVFASDGAQSGSEFLINTTTAGDQSAPTITALSDGRFAVAWTDNSQSGGDPSGTAIRGQVFNANGTASGAEFLINSTTANAQSAPAMSALSDGGFVVVWTDNSQSGGDTSGSAIRGQVFSNAGTPTGAEFRVNTTTLNDQFAPVVTTLANGRFVVAWADNSQTDGDTSGLAIRAQVFEADGAHFGDEFLANTTNRDHQSEPTIMALPDGRFVIAWTDASRYRGEDHDSEGIAIRGQIFSDYGLRLGSEFRLNAFTHDNLSQPTISALPDGRLVAAWVLKPDDLGPFRGGSVDLNRFRGFSKWFSAFVMPPPLRASAG